MTKIRWRFRGTAAASAGLITATLLACGGDDTTSNVPDSGGMDSSASSMDAKSDSTSSSSDGQAADQSVDSPAMMDAAKEAGDGSPKDVTVDSSDGALPFIDVCIQIDQDAVYDISCADYNCDGIIPTPATHDDRSLTWAATITDDAMTAIGTTGTNTGYINTLLNSDCRFAGLNDILAATGNGASAIADFNAQINNFILQFLNCGIPEGGTPKFLDLVPTSAQSKTFTLADVQGISDDFVSSVIGGASVEWYRSIAGGHGAVPPAEPLTGDQVDQIKARLAALAAEVTGLNQSTTKYSLSKCGADAGTDAGMDAGDAGDASHD